MRKLFLTCAILGAAFAALAQPSLPTPPKTVTPKTTVTTKSMNQASSFLISWPAVANVDHYELQSSVNLKTWTTLTNTTATSVVVPNEGPMKFFMTKAYVITNVSVKVAWNPSPSQSVAGYRAYYGASHLGYTNAVYSATTNAVITGLRSGIVYYFNATAFNASGLESDYDGEISYLIPFGLVSLPASIAAIQ